MAAGWAVGSICGRTTDQRREELEFRPGSALRVSCVSLGSVPAFSGPQFTFGPRKELNSVISGALPVSVVLGL